MNQDQRNLRRAAMADFLQSLADLESTFIEPLEDSLPSDSPPTPAPPSEANVHPAAPATGATYPGEAPSSDVLKKEEL